MYKYKYKYVRGEDNTRLLPLSCTLDTSSANISSGPMGSDKRATVFANIRQHDGTWWDQGGGRHSLPEPPLLLQLQFET